MKIRKKIPQVVLNCIFIILSLSIIFPFILMVSASLSNEGDLALNGTSIIPRVFDLTAYKYVWQNKNIILDAYKVTGIFSVASMALGTFLMALIAYPLSRGDYKKKGFVSFYLFFTMLFGGGLVPTYILITKYLHLSDSYWVYILPGLISPWYVFMIRTFFKGIPEELLEAATIDGASEYRIFSTMIIPKKPLPMLLQAQYTDIKPTDITIRMTEIIAVGRLFQRINRKQ